METVDVIHLVSYPIEWHSGKIKLDPRALMGLNSVVKLLEAGASRNVLFTGVLKPKSEDGDTPISSIYAAILRERLRKKGIDDVNVLSEGEILTSQEAAKKGSKETGEEVDFLIKECAKRGWEGALTLGYDLHEPRIRNRFQHIKPFLKWSVRSSNDVLSDFHPQFQNKFLKSAYALRTRPGFAKQEDQKMWILRFDHNNFILPIISHILPNTLKQHLSG